MQSKTQLVFHPKGKLPLKMGDQDSPWYLKNVLEKVLHGSNGDNI